MHEGARSTQLGLRGWPRAAEDVIVARDLVLAETTGARYHVAHISSLGAVRLIREAKLVAMNEKGEEVEKKESSRYLLRYHRFVRNVRVDGDHVDLTFDAKGVREIRGVWHRLGAAAEEGEVQRISSLSAAKSAKMTKGVARLLYVRREHGEGEVRFHPVFRIEKGKKSKDVDVIR